MAIENAVVPAAGRATRLLSATKQQPKCMLPLFDRGSAGSLVLKPVVERIFDQLFDDGVRNFYFIVGQGLRAIQDHFSPDRDFVEYLKERDKVPQALELQKFYGRITQAGLFWIRQPEPKGFGDAVLQARSAIGGQPFFVHAGDTFVISSSPIIQRLARARAETDSAAVLTLRTVEDTRQLGEANVKPLENGLFEVQSVVEKPERPVSRLAILPLYIFDESIFRALSETQPGKLGELQLTDGIQRLIDTGHRVTAVKMNSDDVWLDIGTPESYWNALEFTYKYYSASRGENP